MKQAQSNDGDSQVQGLKAKRTDIKQSYPKGSLSLICCHVRNIVESMLISHLDRMPCPNEK